MICFRAGNTVNVVTDVSSQAVAVPFMAANQAPKMVRITTKPGSYAFVAVGTSAVTVNKYNGVMVTDTPSFLKTLGNSHIAFIQGDGETFISITAVEGT